MKKQELSPEKIVALVAAWPKEEQLNLVRALLYQIGPDESELKNPLPRIPTFEKAAGLLKTDKPTPSDEEVERILAFDRER